MNISSAASFQMPSLQTMKANTEKNLAEKIEGPLMDEERARVTMQRLLDPGDWSDIPDDHLEELLNAPYIPEFSERGSRVAGYRRMILWSNDLRAADTLKDIEGIYSDFKKDLQSKWPGLADKVFGFTVAENGQLQVTSPPNGLDDFDKKILNTLLNETKDLQSLTLKHAKAVMELVQLDKEQFAGKLIVDLTNFHKIIDYGLLLNKGALQLEKTDSWLKQLHTYAEMTKVGEKQGLHIEA